MKPSTSARIIERDGLEIDSKQGFGRFPEKPAPEKIIKIIDFITKTGCPENHPDLCLAPLNPQEGRHEIIYNLEIPGKRRPYDFYAWCAICQKWKFLDGCLVWSENDAAIRPVGNRCAKDHFGVFRWSTMISDYKREISVKNSQYYLIDTLPSLSCRRSAINDLLPLADFLQKEHRNLFRNAPIFADFLVQADRQKHGVLFVTRKQESKHGPAGFKSGEGNSNYSEVDVGRIRGLPLLKNGFRPASKLRKLELDLKLMEINGGEEAALNFVAEMEEDMAVLKAKSLKKLLANSDKLEKKIKDAALFCTVTNFQQIVNWARDPDSPCPYRVEFDGNVLRVRESGATLGRGLN